MAYSPQEEVLRGARELTTWWSSGLQEKELAPRLASSSDSLTLWPCNQKSQLGLEFLSPASPCKPTKFNCFRLKDEVISWEQELKKRGMSPDHVNEVVK